MSGGDFITNLLLSGAGLTPPGARPAAARREPPLQAPPQQLAPASHAAPPHETREAPRRAPEAESLAGAAADSLPFALTSGSRDAANPSDETSTGPAARTPEPDPASGRAEGLMGLMFEQGRRRAPRERADESDQHATAAPRADSPAPLLGRAPSSSLAGVPDGEARGESLDAPTATGHAEASGLRALLRGARAANPVDAVDAPPVTPPRVASVEASPRADAEAPSASAQAGAARAEGRAAELRPGPESGGRQNVQAGRERAGRGSGERGARVTIDRLEVRVFAEAPAPTPAPEPPPGAVFSDEPAGWERYYLGRGPLGF